VTEYICFENRPPMHTDGHRWTVIDLGCVREYKGWLLPTLSCESNTVQGDAHRWILGVRLCYLLVKKFML